MIVVSDGIDYAMDHGVSQWVRRGPFGQGQDGQMIERETRYMAIKRLIREYTQEHTKSPEAARAALIREGIYTADGELMPQFGGPKLKAARGAKPKLQP